MQPDTFFIAGGTLAADSPSYIERAADRELLQALLAGEYAYVLDSRQKGKSSLMARAISRLAAAGVLTVRLDLQRFGANLDAERWYAGLLRVIGQELELRKPLFDYWAAHQEVGPLVRLLGALEDVVLPWLGDRRLVVFIDEIDYVRSLPFPTDELFAGLRELYNRRSADPRFRQLAFCLLGVATPSDLIQDVRITPFNVGRRIELTDLTLEECAPLASGLSRLTPHASRIISRIHYWTNGHPYLTQRLCQAIVEDGVASRPSDVDRVVERLFFAAKSREEEPNLHDVSRRVLESDPGERSAEEYRSAVLHMYSRVRSGRASVPADETDPLVAVLKLSGLTTVVEGYLWVRNRLYYRVFDNAWLRGSLPNAEIVRQNAAARRATVRTAAVTGCVVAGSAAILALAWGRSRLLAEKGAVEANRDHLRIEGGQLASQVRSGQDQLMSIRAQVANLKAEETDAANTAAALRESVAIAYRDVRTPIRIAIDAGHGGVPGPHDDSSVGGQAIYRGRSVTEAQLTLRFARASEISLRRLGITPFMIRTTAAEKVRLGDRARTANRAGCTVLISLHLDGSVRANSRSGITVYSRGDRASQKLGQDLARRLSNSLSLQSHGCLPDTTLFRSGMRIVRNFQGIGLEAEIGYINNDYDLGILVRDDTPRRVGATISDWLVANASALGVDGGAHGLRASRDQSR